MIESNKQPVAALLLSPLWDRIKVRYSIKQLAAIEKRLLHLLIGIGVALLLIGWILLQFYHFGRGGFLG